MLLAILGNRFDELDYRERRPLDDVGPRAPGGSLFGEELFRLLAAGLRALEDNAFRSPPLSLVDARIGYRSASGRRV